MRNTISLSTLCILPFWLVLQGAQSPLTNSYNKGSDNVGHGARGSNVDNLNSFLGEQGQENENLLTNLEQAAEDDLVQQREESDEKYQEAWERLERREKEMDKNSKERLKQLKQNDTYTPRPTNTSLGIDPLQKEEGPPSSLQEVYSEINKTERRIAQLQSSAKDWGSEEDDNSGFPDDDKKGDFATLLILPAIVVTSCAVFFAYKRVPGCPYLKKRFIGKRERKLQEEMRFSLSMSRLRDHLGGYFFLIFGLYRIFVSKRG